MQKHQDVQGNILRAEIIDFKTIEGGENPTESDSLDWTELALQVQLYARAGDEVLGQSARIGSIKSPTSGGKRYRKPLKEIPETIDSCTKWDGRFSDCGSTTWIGITMNVSKESCLW